MFSNSKIKEFNVFYDKIGSPYFTGETLTGTVRLHLTEEKQVKDIKIQIKGKCLVIWIESRYFRGFKNYVSKEDYCQATSHILQSQGNDIVTISEGEHNFPFSFTLPKDIPSSFESKHGRVRYTITASLEGPKKVEKKTRTKISVVFPLDLNQYFITGLGVDDEDNDSVTQCCCCPRGFIANRIVVPCISYCSGETIDAKIFFENNALNTRVTKVSMKIKQLVFFYSTNTPGVKELAKNVARAEEKGPFGRKEEVTLKILIPALPSSILEHCSYIDIKYFLEITIHLSGLHRNIIRLYPLLIGNTPFNPDSLEYHMSLARGDVGLPEFSPERLVTFPPRLIEHDLGRSEEPAEGQQTTSNVSEIPHPSAEIIWNNLETSSTSPATSGRLEVTSDL